MTIGLTMMEAEKIVPASTLCEKSAVAIFLAKARRNPRDAMSAILAAKYGITMKAVRDVWNLRTWAHSTVPYWSRADHQLFLKKNLCVNCKRKGVETLDRACKACSVPRRRGRPLTGADTRYSTHAGGNTVLPRPQRERDAQIHGAKGICKATVSTAHRCNSSASEWRVLEHAPPQGLASSRASCQVTTNNVQGPAPCMQAQQVLQDYPLRHPRGIQFISTESPSSMSQQLRRHHVPRGIYLQQEHFSSTSSAISMYGTNRDGATYQVPRDIVQGPAPGMCTK